jgi:hypothetical protein
MRVDSPRICQSVMDSTRLTTMEQLLQRKEMEQSSMQRMLRSRPAPELSSYIEGYKIGMVGGDATDTVRQSMIGGPPLGAGSARVEDASMSRFLDDSHLASASVPTSFLAGMETIPSITGEPAESEASLSGMSSNGGGQRQSATDLLFAVLDEDGDGVITIDEMRKGLRGPRRSPKRSRGGGGGGGSNHGSAHGSAAASSREWSSGRDGEASGVGLLLAKSDTVRMLTPALI